MSIPDSFPMRMGSRYVLVSAKDLEDMDRRRELYRATASVSTAICQSFGGDQRCPI